MSEPNETGLINGVLEDGFSSVDDFLSKMKEIDDKLKAISEEHIQQVGRALYESGFRVICDSDLRDSEIKVSPAIHHAALQAHLGRVLPPHNRSTRPQPNESETQDAN